MSASVRPLRRADVDGALSCWRNLLDHAATIDARFRTHPNAAAAMREYALGTWLATRPFPAAWLAVDADDRPVGFIFGEALYPLPIIENAPRARIGDVWVDPSARGRGVGRALVHTWTEAARAAGHEGVEVATLARDAAALAFWQRMGFDAWQVILRTP